MATKTNKAVNIKFKPTKEAIKRTKKPTSYNISIRAYNENAALIENIVKSTKQRTITGAIYMVLREYEWHKRTISELEAENAAIQAELQRLKSGVNKFKEFFAFITTKETAAEKKLREFNSKRPQARISYPDDDFNEDDDF